MRSMRATLALLCLGNQGCTAHGPPVDPVPHEQAQRPGKAAVGPRLAVPNAYWQEAVSRECYWPSKWDDVQPSSDGILLTSLSGSSLAHCDIAGQCELACTPECDELTTDATGGHWCLRGKLGGGASMGDFERPQHFYIMWSGDRGRHWVKADFGRSIWSIASAPGEPIALSRNLSDLITADSLLAQDNDILVPRQGALYGYSDTELIRRDGSREMRGPLPQLAAVAERSSSDGSLRLEVGRHCWLTVPGHVWRADCRELRFSEFAWQGMNAGEASFIVRRVLDNDSGCWIMGDLYRANGVVAFVARCEERSWFLEISPASAPTHLVSATTFPDHAALALIAEATPGQESWTYRITSDGRESYWPLECIGGRCNGQP